MTAFAIETMPLAGVGTGKAHRAHLAGLLAAIAVCALPTLAAAQQPRLIPPHDVDILYQLDGPAAQQIPGGAPDGVRLQWNAAGQRLRAEPVGGIVYAITDLRRRVADLVFATQSSVLELPLRGGDPQALLAGSDARFTRGGTGRVLGMECDEWTVHARHLDATGCVTADGVVLRAEGTWNGQPGRAVALSVGRSPIPAARFAPPANFFVMPLGTR